VLEASLHGKRGGGEDDAGKVLEEQLFEQSGDVDGRGLEVRGHGRVAALAAAPLEPEDGVLVVGLQ
jgi:hypothetical protein